jgi:hypothetical protein
LKIKNTQHCAKYLGDITINVRTCKVERGTREAKEYPVRRGVRYNGLWLNKPGINDEIKKSNDAGNANGIVMPRFLFYSQNRVPASKTQPICSLEKILSKKSCGKP